MLVKDAHPSPQLWKAWANYEGLNDLINDPTEDMG